MLRLDEHSLKSLEANFEKGDRLVHGLSGLPFVDVTDYNAELRDGDRFLGDRACKGAFRNIVDRARERLREGGEDPLGSMSTVELGKRGLDAVLTSGKPEAAGLVLGAIEAFAHELALVTRHLLTTPGWQGVERVAVGGGMRASRCGELAIGRASVLLRSAGMKVSLQPILHHPDEAGLVGAIGLMPPAWLLGYDGMLAVDIGGSNMRAGVVELNRKKAPDLCQARVMSLDIWRHCDERPGRDEAVDRLCGMLRDLARRARKDRLNLAPVIGVGCPGVLTPDGTIDRGSQNLPGEWNGAQFNLPDVLRTAIPEIGKQPTKVVMHNDAVIQGLSELPRMQDVSRWGVLTIGTGLGNASFASHAVT